VVDFMQFQNGNLQWNIFFTRPMHDWEVDLVSSFFDPLYFLRVKQGGEVRICWIPSKRRKSEVRSYHVLSIPGSYISYPFLGRVFEGLKLFESGIFCIDDDNRKNLEFR
jgi:hypothetical protein